MPLPLWNDDMKRNSFLFLACFTALSGIGLSVLLPLPVPPMETSTAARNVTRLRSATGQDLLGSRPFVQRSLFRSLETSATAPSEAPATPEQASQQHEASLRLAGLVRRSGDVLAVIEVEGKNETILGRVGDMVEGWKIQRIGLRDVQLSKGDQLTTLPLDPTRSP